MVVRPPPSVSAAYVTSPRFVALLTLLFFVSQATIGVLLGPKLPADVAVLQAEALAFPSRARDVVLAWTAEEKARFERHFAVDTLHPLIYGAWFAAWTALESSRNATGVPFFASYYRWVAALALASACDLGENAIHYALLKDPHGVSDGALRFAALLSTFKWMVTVPTGIWCLASFVARMTVARATTTTKHQKEN